MSIPISNKKDYSNFKDPENKKADGKSPSLDIRSVKSSSKDIGISASKSDKKELMEKNAKEIKDLQAKVNAKEIAELKTKINAKELKKLNKEIKSQETQLQIMINAKKIKELEALVASKNEIPDHSVIDSKFTKVSDQEVESVKKQMVNVNPKYKDDATLKVMEKFNLVPNHKIEVKNAIYYCTDLFTLNKNKIMTMGLVKVKDKVYPRLFALSDSQGLWRVVPFGEKDEGKISYFGKGLIESDTQLPFELHFALLELKSKEEFINEKAFEAVFVNTGRFQNEKYTENTKYEEFFNLIGDEDELRLEIEKKKRNPENIHLPSEKSCPNYKNMKIKNTHLPLYGDVKAVYVPSKDESLSYLFYEAKDNRAYLAGVQSNKPDINIFGIHETAKDLNAAGSPLLEYKSQIDVDHQPSFGATTYDYSGSQYRNNWNYIRRLPVIKDYYKNRKIPMPGSL